MEIKKAIIPCAGMGTRFLPCTKVVAKELFPIIDKPTIQLIVEELNASGISEIIFVINKQKQMIKQYFKKDPELEQCLKERGKEELKDEISKISKLAKFRYVYQKEPKGNGHAVLMAKKEIKNEPFIVNWADDLILGKKEPYFSQLIRVFKKYQKSVISVIKTDEAGMKRYGIIKAEPVERGIFRVFQVIEKPGPGQAPSNLANVGGFVLTPIIFKILEKTKPGKGGEIWLQDAINTLCQKEPVYAFQFEGEYYDVGEKLGFLKSIVKMALQREDLKEEFKKYLKSLKYN